jgi:hypothetical protein
MERDAVIRRLIRRDEIVVRQAQVRALAKPRGRLKKANLQKEMNDGA